jgi:uncharacterized repeat protein (TIGR01451 family)
MKKQLLILRRMILVLTLWGVIAYPRAVQTQPGHAASLPRPTPLAAPGAMSAEQRDLRSSVQHLAVEPELLHHLLESEPDRQYQVIVEMTEQAHAPQLASDAVLEARASYVVAELQETARKSQAGLLAFLEARQSEGHVQSYRSFWIFNGLAVIADADSLLEIAAQPEVRLIREDRWRQWVDPLAIEETLDSASDAPGLWNLAQIQANLAWINLGTTGSGATVGIMDTGVDWQHPALQLQYRGYKPSGLSVHEGNWFCATDEGYLYPYDGHGHGTHVTGTAVGSQGADGVAVGVAPGAQWIAVKTLNNAGYGYDSWIHAAFEWILAPAGDPALAPDVVNSSWGSPVGQDEIFRADVQALRAAGIVPIFSAGNDGPEPGTVGSPGSYPETIAVGATDDLDQVTSFSSRGPSVWDEIKPEVSAPGVQIYSSLPGGAYGTANGTSMAAPHVTGLVALMLQADPKLSVDDIETILTSTALPLGEQVPNNDTGWGRIDAYKAVAVAMQAGYVSGHVIRQSDLQPVSYGLVTAFDHEGELQGQATVDQDGRFSLALPEGRYELEANAFGYEPDRARNVSIVTGGSVTLDFELRAAPAGTLWGEITDTTMGVSVGAQVAVEGTPALTVSDPETGQYSIALPAGTYTVTAEQNGYRRATVGSVVVAVDQITRQDLSLTAAPTLLLVDSGRWYYASQASYFRSALEDRDYVYDFWEIRSLDTDVPEEEDLAPFDITVWSAPFDSPGLIGAGDVISGYLTSGGNMLLAGQDVGYWDSGFGDWVWQYYFKEQLRAQVLSDNAGREDVIGVLGNILDGLILPLNGPDSAGNQKTPDLIDVLDPQDASLIANYEGVGGAALRASGCQSYRAVYLAAGLEGLGDRQTRAEVMERALTWLDSPHPSVETRLAPTSQESVWLGGPITYTVELQNRGQSVDRFDLELSPSAWPVTVFDGGFTQAITQSLVLGACQTQTVGVQIAVPADVGWNATDVVTLTARSQADPGVAADAVFSSKSPAPILLVDDHRWYDTSDRYRTALEARQLPYDGWRIDQTTISGRHDLSLQRLEHYPLVIWFTAYDWYKTLSPEQETMLSTYLDGGGRLLLSSQDYLYTSGFTDFASDYLGVLQYTEDLTVTQTVGAVGHPVGKGLGPMDLAYPFRNFSDALRPKPAASTAFWGQHGQPVALTMNRSPWKTAFYAFSLEALGPSDMAMVVGSTVDWLSPLGDSALAVDLPVAAAGAELAYTLSIRNTGPKPLGDASLSNPMPPHTAFVPGSLEGPAVYDPGSQSITWAGALDPGQAITITYRLEIDRPLPDGSIIENVAQLSDETGLSLERTAISQVDSAYLGSSAKASSAATSLPGRVLTYTLTLRNDGLRPADAQLTDRIPANSYHTPDSGWASSGVLTSTAHLLVWSGTIAAGNMVTITFPVVITPAVEGFYVYNRATLTDDWGDTVPMETHTLMQTYLLLPLVLKGF